MIKNPFNALYVTEQLQGLDFPAMFSPTLIPFVMPIFQPGNVMLSGTQGTGKSMLLALLDSEIRIAFHKSSEHDYPVPPDFSRFINASINLSNSHVLKFNEREFAANTEENEARSKSFFADYFNTYVLRDLFRSLQTLDEASSPEFLDLVGIESVHERAMKHISESDTCRDIMGQPDSLDDAIDILSKRQRGYLDFLNFKRGVEEVPEQIQSTLTGIGEPIAAVANCLRSSGVIAKGTNIFVTIDQGEELLRLEQSDSSSNEYGRFRAVLDKLFSSRESSVSYRLGIRPNAVWNGKSEAVRDYIPIALDELFAKTEHGGELFPVLAEDVFRRRLMAVGMQKTAKAADPLKAAFGSSPRSIDRAQACAPKNSPERVLKIETSWAEDVGRRLCELAQSDVLSAKLGEAWYRQVSARLNGISRVSRSEFQKATSEMAAFDSGELPWQADERRWWRKERNSQATLQIAAANRQRIPYHGKRDILSLAGRNILMFSVICQKIWDSRIQRSGGTNSTSELPFTKIEQGDGIRSASNVWRDKISAAPDADTVRRLIDELGKRLKKQLRGDHPMSYPGANGFSLSVAELDQDKEIHELLIHATAEGFLNTMKHTPKSAGRGQSLKWYLHPILSVFYELTTARTKEPLYPKVTELRGWLEGAGVIEKRFSSVTKPQPPTQRSLFGDGDDA